MASYSPPPLPPPLERITRSLSNHSISSASSTSSSPLPPTPHASTLTAHALNLRATTAKLNGLGLATAHSSTFPAPSPSPTATQHHGRPPEDIPEQTTAKPRLSSPTLTQSDAKLKHSRPADSPPSTLVYPASTSARFSPTRPKTSPEISSIRTIRDRSLSPALSRSSRDTTTPRQSVFSVSPTSQRRKSTVAESEETNAARDGGETSAGRPLSSPEDTSLASSVESLKSRKGKRAAGDLSERNQSVSVSLRLLLDSR